MRTVLVTGASGVVGRSAAQAFAGAGWRVLAVSRRNPFITQPGPGEIIHLSLDLADAAASRAALAAYPAIGHLVYAAVAEEPGLVSGWFDAATMQRNLVMLKAVLTPLAEAGALQHVSILQGGKAYGAHLHPVSVPAREDDPRDDHPNFYWLHEDAVRAAAAQHGFNFTVLRPPVIVGGAVGAAMNLVVPIAAYAMLCRERGVPFAFPGGVAKPFQMVDARIVADALLWAADAPAAANQIFNVDNGDVADWRAMWAAMAAALGVEPGEDDPVSLTRTLGESGSLWSSIAAREHLAEPHLPALLGQSHHYADIILGFGQSIAPPPLFLSPIKIRRAGFAAYMDSRETMLFWIDDLRRRRFIN